VVPTYIVRFGGSPEIGVLQSTGAKTYIVHEVFFSGQDAHEMPGERRWRKEECAFATAKTLELVRAFKVFERSYRERMSELRQEMQEHAKPLIEEIRASTQPGETIG